MGEERDSSDVNERDAKAGDASEPAKGAAPTDGSGRRKFLLATLAGVSGVTVATVGGVELYEQRKEAREASLRDRPGIIDPNAVVTERRRLGRTNLEVGVIAIGAGALTGPNPLYRAVDKGMNYIDTSCCYKHSEETIGRAIGERPSLRDSLVIATKWDPDGKTTKAEMLKSLDESLRRMRTDHVEVMQIHWLGGGHKDMSGSGYERLDNPELYAAMEEAKRLGKVRFFGATSHDGDRGPILEYAIDKGFEVILVKLNILDFDAAKIPSLLAKAKAKDVGVVAMKAIPGGERLPAGYEESRWSVFQANLRWALEQNNVHTVVNSKVGFDPHSQDAAASAAQKKLGLQDRALLEQFASALTQSYCRECGSDVHGGGCVTACPAGIQIPHVAHFAMYDRDYNWHEYARELYHGLPENKRWADICATCTLCTEHCPYGVDAAERVRWAKRSLA